MLLSIVIPAFNEEKELPGCLAAIGAAVAACGLGTGEVEVVVCDNNSTDLTAEVARRAAAVVVFEPVNQISRARNTGAAAARGEWLLFVDADSRLDPVNLRRVVALARANEPVVGGGCVIALEGVPWWTRPGVWAWNFYSAVRGVAAGSFVFCRAEVHREVGGFSVERFAAEELDYSRQLRACGRAQGRRFVVLRGFWTGLAAAANRSAFTSENCLIFSLELINLIFDGSGAAEGVGRDGYIHETLLISQNEECQISKSNFVTGTH